MKKQLIYIFTLSFLLSISAAGSPFPVLIKTVDNSKEMILTIEGTEEYIVTLKDASSRNLYKERLNENKYIKAFDLKALPEGDYYLEIDSRYMIEIYTITITSNELSANDSDKTVIFKPQVVQKGNKVDVGYYLTTANTTTLTILDKNNRVIHETQLNNKSGSKRYDLSKLAPGKYIFTFTHAERSYSRTINIK